jgi:hypothetical protein
MITFALVVFPYREISFELQYNYSSGKCWEWEIVQLLLMEAIAKFVYEANSMVLVTINICKLDIL